jgi:hypothetical protein
MAPKFVEWSGLSAGFLLREQVLDGLRVGPVFRGETEWAALCELKPA